MAICNKCFYLLHCLHRSRRGTPLAEQPPSSALVLRWVEAVPARAASTCGRRVWICRGARACQFESLSHGLLGGLDDAHLVVLARTSCRRRAPLVPTRRRVLLFICAHAENLKLVVVARAGQHELLVVDTVVDVVLVYKGSAWFSLMAIRG